MNKIAFRFGRLPEVDPSDILAQLRDPRVGRHLPLLPPDPDRKLVEQIVAAKEDCWARDGLGHWAIFKGTEYAGWGGFQKEDDEWDFGLVLRAEFFACGKKLALQVLDWARAETAIEEVTFLLPLSRSRRALLRLGAERIGVFSHGGIPFNKWRLDLRGAAN